METDLAASTSLTSSTSTTSTSTSAGLPDTASSSIKRAAGPNQGDENPSKRIKKVYYISSVSCSILHPT